MAMRRGGASQQRKEIEKYGGSSCGPCGSARSEEAGHRASVHMACARMASSLRQWAKIKAHPELLCAAMSMSSRLRKAGSAGRSM